MLLLSHPLEIGVHLWLDGKRIVDFVLAIIELFSLALTAVALLNEICRNLLLAWVSAVVVCLCVCLSVCVSVTRRYCVKTAKN